MLYTRKGDDGTTKTFGCNQRISKSSTITEALGSLDEINSYLGLCKIKAEEKKLTFPQIQNQTLWSIIHNIQKNLFIIQAELAGSPMCISEEKVKELEMITDSIEQELPLIKNFFISGGVELATLFDIARTISRRAERMFSPLLRETSYSLDGPPRRTATLNLEEIIARLYYILNSFPRSLLW